MLNELNGLHYSEIVSAIRLHLVEMDALHDAKDYSILVHAIQELSMYGWRLQKAVEREQSETMAIMAAMLAKHSDRGSDADGG